ncbi:MAG TPA: 30S ribosomal protein S17 [Candidatus Nitrosotenuis sp.]|nr:30S ribosomal protein S17 [Candidatus Nitrosotenuis sp.]
MKETEQKQIYKGIVMDNGKPLSVRGKLFEGKVVSAKNKNTVVIQRESPLYITKTKRYARSKSTIHAYKSSKLEIKEGTVVVAAECRPIAKSVSFVVVEVKS